MLAWAHLTGEETEAPSQAGKWQSRGLNPGQALCSRPPYSVLKLGAPAGIPVLGFESCHTTDALERVRSLVERSGDRLLRISAQSSLGARALQRGGPALPRGHASVGGSRALLREPW